jgi:signal peptidase I
MRKLLFILFLVILSACTKVELPVPVPPTNTDIFSVKESAVVDGQEIKFTLKTDGVYTLTIGNDATGQVITRERFIGKIGENKLTLYTKSLPTSYLYLLLEDGNKTQVGKTTIIIK